MENHFFSEPILVPLATATTIVQSNDTAIRTSTDESNRIDTETNSYESATGMTITFPTWKVIVYRKQSSTNNNNNSEDCDSHNDDESELGGGGGEGGGGGGVKVQYIRNGNSTDAQLTTKGTNTDTNTRIEVGVLYINDTTLPPRRSVNNRQGNKKTGSTSSTSTSGSGSGSGKVLWKLPDNYDTVPKFGHIEQSRLWELYKQQKKHRRKKVIQTNTNTNTNTDIDTTNNRTTDCSETSVSMSVRVSEHDETEADADACTETILSPTKSTILSLESSPPKPSPPPGFPVQAPPGFVGPGTTSSLPPPGFHNGSAAATLSTLHVTQQQQQQQQQQDTTTATTANSSSENGTNNTNGTYTSIQKRFSIEKSSTNAIPCDITSTNTTTSSQPQIAELLGTVVATTFAQSITSNNIQDGWLPYYFDVTDSIHHNQQSARSTLLIGAATATSTTVQQRYQQWMSLTQTGTVWEFHGFTVQPRIIIQPTTTTTYPSVGVGTNGLHNLTSTNGTINSNTKSKKKKKGLGQNSTTTTCSVTKNVVDSINVDKNKSYTDNEDVLIVMTGKVLQPQTGWFGYSLTLLLSSTIHESSNNFNNNNNKTKLDDIYQFAIMNEVLTLFPMS